MEERRKSQPQRLRGWRTVLAAAMVVAATLIALQMCLSASHGAGAEGMFGNAAIAFGIILATVAGRHSVDSLASGTGTGGAWAALTTAAKPGEPAAPPPPDAVEKIVTTVETTGTPGVPR